MTNYSNTPSLDDLISSWVYDIGTDTGGGGTICYALHNPGVLAHLEDNGWKADERGVPCSSDRVEGFSDEPCIDHVHFAAAKASHPLHILEMEAQLSILGTLVDDVMDSLDDQDGALRQRVFSTMMFRKACINVTLERLREGVPMDDALAALAPLGVVEERT